MKNLYLTTRANFSFHPQASHQRMKLSDSSSLVAGLSSDLDSTGHSQEAKRSVTAKSLSEGQLVPTTTTLEEVFSVLCVMYDQLDMYSARLNAVRLSGTAMMAFSACCHRPQGRKKQDRLAEPRRR